MFTIILNESRQLVRNRLVAASALFVPLLFAIVLVLSRDTFRAPELVVGVTVVSISALGLYVTATTTLAARRQTLFLKRMRSGTASDSAILSGILLPVVAVNLAQLVVILVVMAVVGAPPANVAVVVIGVVAVEIMFVSLAVLTSAFTRSAEHAQFTTLPIFLLSFGAAIWVAFSTSADYLFVKRLLPGGAAAELIADGWAGSVETSNLVPVVVSLSVWPVIALILSRSYFRWEPRH